jgi:hypothetical protein
MSDTEDNRFFRDFWKFVEKFPAKSIGAAISIVAAVGGAGWGLAGLLHPPLLSERNAAQTAFRANGLEVPATDNLVVLIDRLSTELQNKNKLSIGQDAAENISGHWQYKCQALDRNYSHGGDATIDMQMTPYGWQWRLTGTRRWREIDGKRDEISYSWSTDWAAFTDKDRIKYTYRIVTSQGTVSGYADGAITDRRDGKPVRIAGTYYQLPPLDAMYGQYEFTRD